MTFPDTEKRLLIVLSSKENAVRKKNEIDDATNALSSIFERVVIKTFEIDISGGGYYGFCATF